MKVEGAAKNGGGKVRQALQAFVGAVKMGGGKVRQALQAFVQILWHFVPRLA
jgi:hypothetical protein